MPRAFAHPAWWCALALLLVNDHLLKGAGLLPGAVTGKLSDLAGMVVAPPLVALAFGAGRRRARLAAGALVGVGFALVKLWPPAAAALAQALALVFVNSRVWLDAGDLWALVLLPAGYALSRPGDLTLAPPRRALPVLAQRLGIALASLACIATTDFGVGDDDDDDDDHAVGPEIENATGAPLTLVLTSTEGAGGCGLYRDDRVSLLTQDAFGAAREIALDDGERAALSAGAAGAECGAAALAFADGSSVQVFWRDLESIESFAPADDDRRRGRRVVVSGEPGGYDVEIGDDLTGFELGEGEPADPTCEAPEVAYSLEFTLLAQAQGFLEIGELRQAEDGCIEVDWFALEGDTSPDAQRLCVPDWAFPFEVSDRLSVVQNVDPSGARTLRITRYDGDDIDTQLEIWNDDGELAGSHVRALLPIDCVGILSPCGAYLRAVELDIRGHDDPLVPGEDVSVPGARPKTTRLLVGPARDVAWSGATCEGVETSTGATASVLELRSY